VSARWCRAVLLLLAGVGAYVGVWAYFAPGPWHRAFPGLGTYRLPVSGPRSEHLSKDVGAFYLALAALSLITAGRTYDTRLVRATGFTWLLFGVLHLIHHVQHLHAYHGRDRVLNAVALGLLVLAALVLLVPAGPERRPGSGR